MHGRDIIVVGASAGGVEALRTLVAHLPEDLPAALFVVLHTSPEAPSMLATILNRCGRLQAKHAEDGERIAPSRIYVARPDCHLLVRRGHIEVRTGPKENGHRPAVDVLFRSAATAYGVRVAGVILSGNLHDGSAGLHAIKRRGGVAICQDPEDAPFPSMPRSAITRVRVDHVLPLADIGPLLTRLARVAFPVGTEEQPVKELQADGEGRPSVYTCPECHGTLWEIDEAGLMRFKCRVGHGYGAEALADEQAAALEAALWTALRSLEENASLTRRLEERARRDGYEDSAKRFAERAADIEAKAEVVRSALERPT
jgi:two-component system chemotaxis response regulator CheB